ncbi:MAG: FAD-dependent oxidoreductase [Methylophilales bacterium]|nr:FAD-dependent oxidoreductase [Methylophilales bacterium]
MKRKIVVIGGGIVGCLTTMALHKNGAQVTLIERAELGAESSWAGGGVLLPLLPWDYTEPVNQLAIRGAAHYPALSEELTAATGINPEYTVSGLRILAPFNKNAAQQWCAQHKIEFALENDTLWLPHVAQVRNPRLMQALKCWLEMNQIPVIKAEISPITPNQNRVSQLRTSQGATLSCEDVVVTAGAWSQTILGDYSLDIALKPMRGQMLLYQQPVGLLREILYCDDFYLIPRRDGHILAGSTVEDMGFDKTTTKTAAEALHQKASKLLPALEECSAIQHWSGLRPGSPDNIPVIQRHPQLENVWLNTGHFRYGVTMAPAAAEDLVQLLLEKI